MVTKSQVLAMCKKSNMEPKEAEVMKIIQEGKLFRDQYSHIYNYSGDAVDACVDSSRFADPLGLRSSINENILEFLDDEHNAIKKFELAKCDNTNVLLAYIVSYHDYPPEEISSLIKSEDSYLASVGVGLSIINDLPLLIPTSSKEALYKYFRSHQINNESLSHFASKDFINFAFTKILEEEKVIFTWMVNNLTSLVKLEIINPCDDHKFFVKFLKNVKYPNETHKTLYLSVIEKTPDLINKLIKIRLDIDPFTKQTNFTKWLDEVRMFKFISVLRDSLPEEYTSHSVTKFDEVRTNLYEINQNDESLIM